MLDLSIKFRVISTWLWKHSCLGNKKNERINYFVLTGPIDRMKSISDLQTCRESCKEPNLHQAGGDERIAENRNERAEHKLSGEHSNGKEEFSIQKKMWVLNQFTVREKKKTQKTKTRAWEELYLNMVTSIIIVFWMGTQSVLGELWGFRTTCITFTICHYLSTFFATLKIAWLHNLRWGFCLFISCSLS